MELQADPNGEWYAFTPKEGRWEFTQAATGAVAVENLNIAMQARRALSHPIDNPISAVRWTTPSQFNTREEK